MTLPHGLNALNEFVLTVLYSSKVVGSRPISALIVGLPDSGKTELVMQASKIKKVSVQTDLTGFGLATLLPEIERGEIKTIVIPDLARIIEGRGNAARGLIAAFNSLIEEGALNIRTYNVKFSSEKPVRCNALIAITIHSFDEDRDTWAGLGFLSRTVPFFLGYCEDDIKRGLKAIRSGSNLFMPFDDIDLSVQETVSIGDEYLDRLESIARYVGKINADSTAFRSFKNMITLAKAHALLRGYRKVDEADVNFVRTLLPFWFQPCGNDCEYYILQDLIARKKPPLKTEIVEALASRYTDSTVYKYLQVLKDKKLILYDKNGSVVMAE